MGKINFNKNSTISEKKVTCSACPYQVEGKLNTGEYFYFRERWECSRFCIAKTLEDACKNEHPLYEVSGDCWSLGTIEKLIEDYNKKKKYFLECHKPYAKEVFPEVFEKP